MVGCNFITVVFEIKYHIASICFHGEVRNVSEVSQHNSSRIQNTIHVIIK